MGSTLDGIMVSVLLSARIGSIPSIPVQNGSITSCKVGLRHALLGDNGRHWWPTVAFWSRTASARWRARGECKRANTAWLYRFPWTSYGLGMTVELGGGVQQKAYSPHSAVWIDPFHEYSVVGPP